MNKILSMLALSTIASTSTPTFSQLVLITSVNKGSIRAVEEYIAHPNDLKNLKIGQAYVKILLPSSNQYVDKIDIEKYIHE